MSWLTVGRDVEAGYYLITPALGRDPEASEYSYQGALDKALQLASRARTPYKVTTIDGRPLPDGNTKLVIQPGPYNEKGSAR